MFTGLVQGKGTISARRERGGDLQISIDSSALGDVAIRTGESIAVNGVCLTATRVSATTFSADVSNETLDKTTIGNLTVGDSVNLERALVLGQALGGHLVSGHVDAIGEIREFREDGRSWRMQVAIPAHLAHLVAIKGSICVDGVSLTVNEVSDTRFSVNVVPHTLDVTTLGKMRAGTPVNVEVDIIARYLERLLDGRKSGAADVAGSIDSALLTQLGFGEGKK